MQRLLTLKFVISQNYGQSKIHWPRSEFDRGSAHRCLFSFDCVSPLFWKSPEVSITTPPHRDRKMLRNFVSKRRHEISGRFGAWILVEFQQCRFINDLYLIETVQPRCTQFIIKILSSIWVSLDAQYGDCSFVSWCVLFRLLLKTQARIQSNCGFHRAECLTIMWENQSQYSISRGRNTNQFQVHIVPRPENIYSARKFSNAHLLKISSGLRNNFTRDYLRLSKHHLNWLFGSLLRLGKIVCWPDQTVSTKDFPFWASLKDIDSAGQKEWWNRKSKSHMHGEISPH